MKARARLAASLVVAHLVVLVAPFPGARAAITQVTIGDNFFEPESVTVTVGTTVRWRRQSTPSAQLHNVRAEDGSFSSGPCPGAGCIAPGETYSFTFESAGTFPYLCDVHGTTMPGSVKVTSGGGSPSPSQSASPTPTSSATMSPTSTQSASPSPTASGSPSPTPTETLSLVPLPGGDGGSPEPSTTETPGGDDDDNLLGAPGDGDDPANRGALATLAVLALGGSGFLVWRRMIRAK